MLSVSFFYFKRHTFTRYKSLISRHINEGAFNHQNLLAIILNDLAKSFVFTIFIHDSFCQNIYLSYKISIS